MYLGTSSPQHAPRVFLSLGYLAAPPGTLERWIEHGVEEAMEHSTELISFEDHPGPLISLLLFDEIRCGPLSEIERVTLC